MPDILRNNISESDVENHDVVPEEEYLPHTPEKLEYMISWIQKRVVLSKYRHHMWSNVHYNMISEFILNNTYPTLIVYMDVINGLVVQFELPKNDNEQIFYFSRLSGSIGKDVTVEEIGDQLTCGLISGNAIESLLRLMNNIYAPAFLDVKYWPDNIKNEFLSQLHKFMATLSDHRWKIDEKTVLYVPVEAEYLDEEKAINDKELICRLETYAIIHWTRQIKEAISAQDALQTNDNSPLDEIEFWKNRCNDLSGISRQLDKPGVAKICKILDLTNSAYTEPFYKLASKIKEGSNQAASNLKFLNLLTDPCVELNETDPVNIPKILPKIINIIRVIWINSEYYKSKDRLTGIFRKLSNEIIQRCTQSIDLELFFLGHVEKSKKSINEAIQCCKEWVSLYSMTEKTHKKFSDISWDLSQTSIFAQMEAFLQRCADLLEICECQIHFGRYVDGDKSKLPQFGGTNSKQIMTSLYEIEVQLDKLLKNLYPHKNIILNVKSSTWHDYYSSFHASIKDVEILMQTSLKTAFLTVTTVQEGVEIIDLYSHLYARESIRRVIDKSTMFIYDLFNNEMNNVKKELSQSSRHVSSELPHYSSKAFWAKILKKRIERTNMIITRAYFLPDMPVVQDVKKQYQILISTLDDYMRKVYVDWNQFVDNNPQKYLDVPLMKKNPSKPILIEVNFDKILIKIFQEIHYWLRLSFDVPFYAANINEKRMQLLHLKKHVGLVAHDYNSIILTLTDNERNLFKERIRFLDKKLYPGFSKITWASKGISDVFIAECRSHSNRMQTCVNNFAKSNASLKENCRKLSRNLLLKIEENHLYEYRDFEKSQEKYRSVTELKLLKIHNEIAETIKDIYRVFKNDGNDVQMSWITYVEGIDDMIEQALHANVKKSLQVLALAINGDGKSNVQSIFKVRLILDRKLEMLLFEPDLKILSGMVGSLSAHLNHSLSNIKRLVTMFDKRSIKMSISQVISRDDEIKKIMLQINNGIMKNSVYLNSYIATWDNYREIWEIKIQHFINRYRKLDPPVSSFDADIARYTELSNNIEAHETTLNINFILLDCSPMKETLMHICLNWQKSLLDLLYEMAIKDLKLLYNEIVENLEKLSQAPNTLQELAALLKLWDKVNAEQKDTYFRFNPIFDKFMVLQKYQVNIPEEETSLFDNLKDILDKYPGEIETAEKKLKKEKDSFKAILMGQSEEFKKDVKQFVTNFYKNAPFSSNFHVNEALSQIQKYIKSLDNFCAEEKRIDEGLFMFNIDLKKCQEIVTTRRDIDDLKAVWLINLEWNENWNKWKDSIFKDMDQEKMLKVSQDIYDGIETYSEKLKMKEWEIIESTKLTVNQFRKTMPLITDLKNPAIRPRHWSDIKSNMGFNFDEESKSFTVEHIIQYGFDQYAGFIQETSGAATRERMIEKTLDDIADTWNKTDFDVVLYKDSGHYKIKSTNSIFTLLEDNQVELSTMKASRFVKPFEDDVDQWERTLSVVIESIEMLLLVQRQWMYLENIFMGEDIRKQMPKESCDFDNINKSWLEMTKYINKTKNVITCVNYQDIMKKLNFMNMKLETIQKSLDMYLETKRQVFPRFYFLSNDDLLQILGQSKNPTMVVPFMKKLFDNIYQVKILITGSKHEAMSMSSVDEETVSFVIPTLMEGPVESWLCDMEKNMKSTLKEEMKKCRVNLRKNLAKRDKWIKEHPGQCCITSAAIQWTSDVTKALTTVKEKGEQKSLRSIKKRQIIMLNRFSDILRAPMTTMLRLKTVSLITVEVHARDVIDKLLRSKCSDPQAFEWLCQLRFYWDREKDTCSVRQTNSEIFYGYEYLGNSGRLVITPLTDRCFVTLTTSLNLHRGACPKGPAGTGKTETVKDLGKALGCYVIVVNCSEGLDYKSMGRLFSGLAQTGAWGCFDEFNRINIEVLSVVAQQILSILSAHAANTERFIFEGCEIKLMKSCGLFITMNPGYAGRTELPDNLKSMFRPIAMVVPDSTLIAEIILFGEGFKTTRVLAKKVFTLYYLTRQQLSRQDHYDFELRALVSMLRYAGKKKRENLQMSDEEVLLLSMKNMTVAKLIASDRPLFSAIVSDLFPGIDVPVMDYGHLRKHILLNLEKNNLQPTSNAVDKIIQLYETKNSRHSTMIVGQSMSGKSTCWKMLQSSLTEFYKENVEKYKNQAIKVFPINPKSVSLGELYGEFDLNNSEWSDGILSNIMRNVCSDTRNEEKWILFDGPVDTLWIESMNSVMDDNKILTLINGERIALTDDVALLFETRDLSKASPATVSRCGMVYFDINDLNWQVYVDSWLSKKTDASMVLVLDGLFKNYIPKLFEFFEIGECTLLLTVSDMGLIISLCKLFDQLIEHEYDLEGLVDSQFSAAVTMIFQFCIIWSMCSLVNDDNRKKIDNFLREIDGSFPNKDTVYEYFFNKKTKTWTHWEEELKRDFKSNDGLPFHEIVIPTVDTVRYTYLSSKLINAQIPLLLIGPVGTGKTLVAKLTRQGLASKTYNSLTINLSAQTSSTHVQSIIETCVEKRTKGVYVPIGGKKLLTFMDDFNMPTKDQFGTQPPLELIRLWLDYGFWYDRKNQSKKFIKNMTLMCAMGPPGAGRSAISDRLQSHFHAINMTFPHESQIKRIFGSMLNKRLQEFEEDVKLIAETITDATISLYQDIIKTFLPTPNKIHYLFNMRDISKVFQGLLRAEKAYHDSKSIMTRLWIHECFRVFSDRLINGTDIDAFTQLLTDKLATMFNMTFHGICPGNKQPTFGDYQSPNKIYEDVLDADALKETMMGYLVKYNADPRQISLDLVLFKDVIEHVSRICRVIRQSRGNMFLIGIGGSGRQSLTRLASFICGYQVFQVEITRNYNIAEFREDLKKLYWDSGVLNKPSVFLITDGEIVHEAFLEDVGNMLSAGQVPNMYKADEIEEICNALMESEKEVNSTNVAFQFFINRVRENLHIVLCVSPIGDPFRNWIRKFPAIINCTTIDWFQEWPDDGLYEVALKHVNTIENKQVQQISTNLCETFTHVHKSVYACAVRMNHEIKRRVYITQKHYLDFSAGYKTLLLKKEDELWSSCSKLRNGLSKIDDTREKVEAMSVELEDVKTKVSHFQKQCEEYLIVIVQQKREANEQQKYVSQKSERIGEEESKCKHMADLAQHDLDEALPALQEAIIALESLNKKDMTEIKSYGRPPALVEKVMEAVMILRCVEPTWAEAKKQLGDGNFIKTLMNFDKDNISDRVLKKIGQYCSQSDFQPEIIGRVSTAAKSLCMWVRAMEVYGRIYRVVEPKRLRLEAAQTQLKEKQDELQEAMDKLKAVELKMEDLKTQYEEKLSQKKELNDKADHTEMMLDRASKLVSGLASEKVRWSETVKYLEEKLTFLYGDVLLAIAFISYLGPFLSEYRTFLMEDVWMAELNKQEILFSPNFNFNEFMVEAPVIRDWNIQGLPSDSFSTENGIIATFSDRWSLMIDPQNQATKWIKNMENKNKLKIIDMQQSNYLLVIESAVQFGHSVLCKNVGQVLDPSLDSVLKRQIRKEGGVDVLKIGDKMIDYNTNFRFFITTKLSNPHYSPEISAKVSIVNFAVKEQGLESQLLAIVVRKEKPELEEQKDTLVMTIATKKKKLKNLESEILKLLNEATGSLLDDENLINTLQVSKETSFEITEQLEIAETTEKNIDIAREGYRQCARRSAILFFVFNDMGRIDPMYQFSLDAYINLFVNSIKHSLKTAKLDERIINLNNYHTYAVYKFVCRGLFERHKILFSFHMCVKILEAAGKMNKDEYKFFLSGGVVLDRENQMDNPCSNWLPDASWDNISELEKLTNFHGIVNSFEQYTRDWLIWYSSNTPESTPLPGEWDNACNEFQKMIIVRSLRSDRVAFCVSMFIVNNLGNKFVNPPILNMMKVFEDSNCQIPLIFVLSAGVDPTSSLLTLADNCRMANRFQALSLGQGQAPIATRMIMEGIKEGTWLFLANCHLSLSWMPQLSKIIEQIETNKPHRDFRLWLSSRPHDQFPISILQSSIKITTEAPKGIRANMKRLYSFLNEDQYKRCNKGVVYRKLFHSLCFFHAVIVERRKFLMLGWNIPYEFNDSDFEVSENILSIYLDEYEETPWEALKFLIAGISYGGHVTDEFDRRLLMTYINDYFNEDVLNVTFFKFSTLEHYYTPKDGSLNSYIDSINQLPDVDEPEAFWQHSNAEITSQIQETRSLFSTLMSLYPQQTAGVGQDVENQVLEISSAIISQLPKNIDYNATKNIIGNDTSPINVVLLQEIERYNLLLDMIRSHLYSLEQGIKGLVVLSTDIEEIFECISIGKVPHQWNIMYPSQKSLSSWVRDLDIRIGMFSKWAETSHPPKVFWISAFTLPSGFFTAILQTSARLNNVSVDSLTWEYNVMTTDDINLTEAATNGVYIKGLYLQGAGWDIKASNLIEPLSMQLICQMPTIHFKPTENKRRNLKNVYNCPCYYYPDRCGTFNRPSYVISIDLKIGSETCEHWIKRGTAILMNLDT